MKIPFCYNIDNGHDYIFVSSITNFHPKCLLQAQTHHQHYNAPNEIMKYISLLNYLYPCWMWTPDFNVYCLSTPPCKATYSNHLTTWGCGQSSGSSTRMTTTSSSNRVIDYQITDLYSLGNVARFLRLGCPVSCFTHWGLSLERTPGSTLIKPSSVFSCSFTHLGDLLS